MVKNESIISYSKTIQAYGPLPAAQVEVLYFFTPKSSCLMFVWCLRSSFFTCRRPDSVYSRDRSSQCKSEGKRGREARKPLPCKIFKPSYLEYPMPSFTQQGNTLNLTLHRKICLSEDFHFVWGEMDRGWNLLPPLISLNPFA